MRFLCLLWLEFFKAGNCGAFSLRLTREGPGRPGALDCGARRDGDSALSLLAHAPAVFGCAGVGGRDGRRFLSRT